MDYLIRSLQKEEWQEAGKLIKRATNFWYESHGKDQIFQCNDNEMSYFCYLYETMDPGCCLVAEVDKQIAALCFYHPRSTHYSLGILCVDPNFYGRRLGRALIENIAKRAKEEKLNLHLISSAQNLDSFSLYNNLGFITETVYKDVIFTVPEDYECQAISSIHGATIHDIDGMVELEMNLCGQNRRKDYEFIIKHPKNWKCYVSKGEGGQIDGFLASVKHPCSSIIGPGIASNNLAMLNLIKVQLGNYKGTGVLTLLPAENAELHQLLRTDLKFMSNVELHVTQVLVHDASKYVQNQGIKLPSFFPE